MTERRSRPNLALETRRACWKRVWAKLLTPRPNTANTGTDTLAARRNGEAGVPE